MKLRSVLPKAELNGLVAIHSDAVNHVGKTYLAVVAIRVEESTTRADKSRDAKFTITRAEVASADQAPYLAEVLEGNFEDRTGKTPLDLDMPGVEDLRKAFRGKRRAKPEPSLLREPEALTMMPVRLDPAVLSPDETGEEDDVIDAELAEEDFSGLAADDDDVWERDEADEAQAEGEQADSEREDDESSPTAPAFSG